MAESSRLGEIFLELADTLVSDFDVVDFMTTLASACVELLSASEVGVLLADEGGRLHSVGSS
ncbi:MAG: transcriptional regulator, partial [Acidimicrobiales bacterium]